MANSTYSYSTSTTDNSIRYWYDHADGTFTPTKILDSFEERSSKRVKKYAAVDVDDVLFNTIGFRHTGNVLKRKLEDVIAGNTHGIAEKYIPIMKRQAVKFRNRNEKWLTNNYVVVVG